jgi:hypothetical protein
MYEFLNVPILPIYPSLPSLNMQEALAYKNVQRNMTTHQDSIYLPSLSGWPAWRV